MFLFSDCSCDVMGGKKYGFGKFARSIETQKQYIERMGQNRLRGQLAGASNRFPKYPSMDYTPENRLYGLQGLGSYISRVMERYKRIF